MSHIAAAAAASSVAKQVQQQAQEHITSRLKDYKIGGLTKLLGTLKMDDKIVVHLDLRFAPAARLDSAMSPPGS